MISIKDIYYGYGDRYLLENASLHIKPGDKIGLIGRNGAGKSTLLRLINKEYTLESGSIDSAKDCKIGYLNQDLLSILSDESIINVALEAFEELLEVQKRMNALYAEMEVNYSDDLVNKVGLLQEKFEQLNGYSARSQAELILEGLGFSTADLERPLSEFSGGWRMRVMLAKILLQEPNLLLLDEPTNHLDLPSIKWLEEYLMKSKSAFVLVSHDRYFLDNTTTSTVEVWQRQLVEYKGNYSFYEVEKEERSTLQQAAYENQQQYIKQQERFIERFKAKNTKAKQAQSKMKQLDKLERIEQAVTDTTQLKIRFKLDRLPGKIIVDGKGVGKSYDDLVILEGAEFSLLRGDKIALIGANGLGKSTLLRMISGEEKFTGEITEGHNVNKEIFAQHQMESLNLNNDILEELQSFNSKLTETEARSLLGCFLFTDDDVFKRIKVLSGGEKSRVALAKTMCSGANFMLLDEPTNHLDMMAVRVLIEALVEYEGTFITVSHDRHFISETATKIWYIENQKVKEYPGTYKEFEDWYSKRNIESEQNLDKPKLDKPKKEKRSKEQVDKNRVQQLEKKAAKIENQIEKLESEKAEVEAELSKPEIYSDIDKLGVFSARLEELNREIISKTNDWESIVEEIG